MALTESLKAQALRELTEEICQGCGGAKRKGHSFCIQCFKSLPWETKANLYKAFSEGYAELYDEAKTELKAR